MTAPIDLRSDTVTRPTAAMREAMARAEVGDDVYGEDPTVNRLQERVAELLGKQAALFVPSGTMSNQIAVRAHTEHGDALIAAHRAHVYLYEAGGPAALSGVQTVLVGEDGMFGADDVRAALAPGDSHFARTRLVCVENTHNASGGRIFPLERQREIARVAREAGLALHLDGARLWNASVASGVSPAALAEPYDSVSCCLSKGLGAPVGSLLCGSREFIARAHRFRKLFGGGMRQAGVLAAAGLHAVEHHLKRLEEDHANARRLARGIGEIPGLELVREPETNMVFLRTPDAAGLSRRLRERGVLINPISSDTLRAVTHLDVSRPQLESVLVTLRAVAE